MIIKFKSINNLTVKLLFILTISTASLNVCGQSKSDRQILGIKIAKQELKSALSDKSLHNVVDNKENIIKDSLTAIDITEHILFGIYGKDEIREQLPYETYLIDNYWIISGTLPKNELGGTFLIIIDARNCSVLRITHGK